MDVREPSVEEVEAKREREGLVLRQMIEIYCHGVHGEPFGQLCERCAELDAYAQERVRACPRMAVKSFCSTCPVHCYSKRMRERIRSVMRYSGPRMLLHHPVLVVRHMVDTWSAKRAERSRGQQGLTDMRAALRGPCDTLGDDGRPCA